jgi:hypothetical protein
MATKNKERKLKQKQKQSQSVRVVVNLAEKRKRKRRSKPKKKPEEAAEIMNVKPLPPQIIYPSAPVVFSNLEAKPAPPMSLAQTVTEKVKTPVGLLEDIGNVGTEGNVEILDLPTRKETLEELQTPVPATEPEPERPLMIRVPKKKLTLAETLKARLPATMTEDLFVPPPEPVVETMTEPVVERATPAQPKKKGGRPKKTQEGDNKQRLVTEFFKVAKAKNIPEETLQRYDEVYKFNQKSNKKITQLISKIRKNQNVTDQFLNDTLNELFN